MRFKVGLEYLVDVRRNMYTWWTEIRDSMEEISHDIEHRLYTRGVNIWHDEVKRSSVYCGLHMELMPLPALVMLFPELRYLLFDFICLFWTLLYKL